MAVSKGQGPVHSVTTAGQASVASCGAWAPASCPSWVLILLALLLADICLQGLHRDLVLGFWGQGSSRGSSASLLCPRGA